MGIFKKKLYNLPDLSEERALDLYYYNWEQLINRRKNFDNKYLIAFLLSFFNMILDSVSICFWKDLDFLAKSLLFVIVFFVASAWIFYTFKSFQLTKQQMHYEKIIKNIEKEYKVKQSIQKRCDEDSEFMFHWGFRPDFIKIPSRAFTLSILWLPIFNLALFWKDSIENTAPITIILCTIYLVGMLYGLTCLLVKFIK